MHSLFFGMKRAFQSTLRITRKALTRMGLTAARFDMLYAVLQSYDRRIRQSDLRRTLGVTAPTVSRMLASLEKLGFVRRERPHYDTRQRIVILTPAGRKRIRRARRKFISTGWVKLAVDSALAPDRWFDFAHCLERADTFESLLDGCRREYRDTGSLHYRWHPDD